MCSYKILDGLNIEINPKSFKWNTIKSPTVILDLQYFSPLHTFMNVSCLLFLGCTIVTLTSPSASTLNVEWKSYPGASVYLLDLRIVNTTSFPPVVLMQAAPNTKRLVQGLRSGQLYQVTVKAFEILYNPLCTAINTTMTGEETSLKTKQFKGWK